MVQRAEQTSRTMATKTKSHRLRRLISSGLFAPELPPCFVSEQLAKYCRSLLRDIDALPPTKNGKPLSHTYISEPAWFYFPRFMKEDRRHGVPNPINHLLISRALSDNYVKLRAIARQSKISSSPPVFDWSGARALVRPSIDLRDDFRVDLSSRREHFVSSDLRSFYHSIYTHSIPWAIHGKSWSKQPQNRGTEHYGNLLDLLFRNAQGGQTIGLPVGPDTSRLIAEVIASAIDVLLSEKINISQKDASRYIDDYTISCIDGLSGEAIIAALRQSAAHFELDLNGDKTVIVPTSTRHKGGWKETIAAYIPRTNTPTDTDFMRFFYEVDRISETHKDVNIEKFALQNARSSLVSAADWNRNQSIILNIYRRNPSTVSILVELLVLRWTAKKDVRIDTIKEFIENRIPPLAIENRTGEIIWLLFLAVRLTITLSSRAIAPLYEIENSFIAVIVTHLFSTGMIEGKIDNRIWSQSLTGDGLRGPMWLYAYESTSQNWVNVPRHPHVSTDTFFALLEKKNIRFFSPNEGFRSLVHTLRELRNKNNNLQRIRNDFLEDFDITTEDVEVDENENDWVDEY